MNDFYNDVDYIVLSRGFDNKLELYRETADYFREDGKNFMFLNTKDAVEIYNFLVKKGYKVGALIHSTC